MDDARIALEAYRRTYPPASVAIFGEVTCLRIPGAPDSPMLNRIVGLGSSGPPSEETLDEAIAFMGEVTFYVSLEPGAVTDDLVRLLAGARARARMGLDAVRPRRVSRTGRCDGARCPSDRRRRHCRRSRVSNGLPTAFPTEVDPVIRAVTTTPGWTCWIAFDGDRARRSWSPLRRGRDSVLRVRRDACPSTVAREDRARSSRRGSSMRAPSAAPG